MIITLIGMSGIGKTHWSRFFKKLNYHMFSCDEMIEESLRPVLDAQGYAGLADIAKWMGYPTDPQYEENSKKYLQYENESVQEICNYIDTHPKSNIVIDATGSIIYIPQSFVLELKAKSTVVYLEATLEYADQLYQRYITDPKPVIWGSSFHKGPFESTTSALKRCYPELLDFRSEKYAALADITIPYDEHNSFDQTAPDLLSLIRSKI